MVRFFTKTLSLTWRANAPSVVRNQTRSCAQPVHLPLFHIPAMIIHLSLSAMTKACVPCAPRKSCLVVKPTTMIVPAV